VSGSIVPTGETSQGQCIAIKGKFAPCCINHAVLASRAVAPAMSANLYQRGYPKPSLLLQLE